MTSEKEPPVREDAENGDTDEASELLPEPNIDEEAGGHAGATSNKGPDELAGLPVDRGWAWVILFASVFEVFLYGGLMKSLGVFLVEFMKRFNTSASETVLVQTAANITISISGIFVMNVLMKHVSGRMTVCIGVFLIVTAYVIAAFATHIWVLVFTLGIMAGVGTIMIHLPVLSLIGIYFNKHRGKANSLSVAGASLGGLVCGPMYTTMFDYYGYTGTMLISAGMLMNIFISAMLLRAPEFYTKRSKKKKTVGNQETELKDMSVTGTKSVNGDAVLENGVRSTSEEHVAKQYAKGRDNVDEKLSVNHHHTKRRDDVVDDQTSVGSNSPEITETKNLHKLAALNFQRTRALSHDPESANHLPPSPLLHRPRAGTTLSRRNRPVSESSNGGLSYMDALSDSKIMLCSATDIMYGSVASLAMLKPTLEEISLAEAEEIKQEPSLDSEAKPKTCTTIVIDFFKMVFDTSLLKQPVFIHFLCFAVISLPASILTSVFFIPHAKDLGISNQKVGIMLSVIGCVDLVSRVSVGVFSDKKILKPTSIVAIYFILMAIVNNFLRLVNTFPGMMAFVIIQGSMSGVYLALYAVILIECVGIGKFKSSLGFTSMFHGGTVALFFPLTGMLRDKTGNYFLTYHMLSVMQVIGAVLALTLPITHRRIKAKAAAAAAAAQGGIKQQQKTE